MHGFYRVASAVPEIKVADIAFNSSEIVNCINEADKNSASLVVFPELCITGYTCADLFFQNALTDASADALLKIAENTSGLNIISVIGLPFVFNSALYNCAAVLQNGSLLGVIPKSCIPNYREFYEKRWFSPAFSGIREIKSQSGLIPFGTDIIFEYDNEFSLSVEICEDLWSVIPPSSYHSMAGSTIIANLSASNELVGKSEYRKNLVINQSARCVCAYVYSSAGVGESTTDLLFGGHSIIAENGILSAENERFSDKSGITYADIDCARIVNQRISETSIAESRRMADESSGRLNSYRKIALKTVNQIKSIKKKITPTPFVPADNKLKETRCTEIFSIQSSALAKRISHTHSNKSVIGISGGLDSTLALLVIKTAHEKISKPASDIVAITMPCFGTTDRTYNNAVSLCKIIGCDLREKDLKDICSRQLNLLEIDDKCRNTAYENVQARQRTMILMNTANNENGLVIGTGDLSEIALGWSTYNGDHMSMYSVNCGVPKTLIRYLIKWYADRSGRELKRILLDIIDTPVTPELLPPDKNGRISQKTEDIIGPYELHDFFLYHTVKYGAPPDKILFLASIAFKNKYETEFIKKYLALFIKRFFTQQFKRSCIPDGPKVGTIALSPRGDWRMPSDSEFSNWLEKI